MYKKYTIQIFVDYLSMYKTGITDKRSIIKWWEGVTFVTF